MSPLRLRAGVAPCEVAAGQPPSPRFAFFMVSSVRNPIWLPAAPKPGALAFGVLFAIESIARASISAVISVQAYDLLQSSQHVSLLFTAVGLLALMGTLVVPLVIRWTARRFAYTIGALCLVTAAALFASFTVGGQVAAMSIRIFGAACLNVTTSLYILDHIRKADLVRSEPLRLSLSTVSWTIGPGLGVWLYTSYGVWAPQLFSAACALVLLGLFWYLRLSENPAIKPGASTAGNPLRSVRRFIAQPRLRLAWLIAFGRSCFWSSFFIYAPILMITSGLGKDAGGLLVSAGNAVLITAVLFGRVAERVGVRTVIAGAFLGIALATVGAGLAGTEKPLVAAFLLLAASLGAAALDSVGGIPFLRSVRFHERAEMTGVYRTYLDISDLLPPFLYSLVLFFFPLGAVFVVLGIWSMVCAWFAWRYMPKSM